MIIDTDLIATARIGETDILSPENTALVIVDMMTLFCDPAYLAGGSDPRFRSPDTKRREEWFRIQFDSVIPRIKTVLEAFRAAGALVVHAVNARWTRDGREAVLYQRGRSYDYFDTPAMSVTDALAPQSGEVTIRKVTSSAFTGTGLDFLLRNASIENLVLCGQYGNACVFYTAIQGRELGFRNYWLEDGITYVTETHKQLFTALVGARRGPPGVEDGQRNEVPSDFDFGARDWAVLATADEVVRALASPARTAKS